MKRKRRRRWRRVGGGGGGGWEEEKEEEVKEQHESRNYNGVFRSNAAELWAKAIVSFLCTRGEGEQ